MIDSLKFENFRGFIELTISPLKRVNLIAGANNTGKTGILEGLYLLFAENQYLVSQMPSVFRSNTSGLPSQPSGDDFATFWQALFYDKEMDEIPVIFAGIETANSMMCKLKQLQSLVAVFYEKLDKAPAVLRRPGIKRSEVPSFFASSNNPAGNAGNQQNPFATKIIVLSTRLEHPVRDAELFNQVSLLEGGEEKLVSLLRQIDPRLQKLRYLKAPGTYQPLVYAHFGLKHALSINQTGQGFSKLFSLFCQMLVSKAKILLVDEIENGLYYETLSTIWRGIGALAASEDIQVFATTHSRECIVAAHEAFSEMPNYDFALHRLQRVKDGIEAITHDREMLNVAIRSGLEVR